ncbi:CYTH domain-containing protein [Humibacillus xanthopallidus]|nr:CYTH domain-containing protein [Humibacillus xanthopallidus]
MGATHHDEIERKFDVEPSTTFPDLRAADGVASVGQPAELLLEAVYYDTTGHDLAHHGITLRRRTGGADEGWHLKLPAGKDTRREFHEPLGPGDEPVPESFAARVHAAAAGQSFAPVARLTTRRREIALLDANGTPLAHVCDDSVDARALASGREQSWREWEVELAEGPEELLDAVAHLLLAAGATPSASGSKLGRALGVSFRTKRHA